MRQIDRHSLLMVAAIITMGIIANDVRAQSPGHWVGDVPAGRGYFARVDALWLKRDESDAATLATLNSMGSPGRVANLRTEDIGFDYEPGLRVVAGMMLNNCTQAEVEYFGVDDFDGDAATLVLPTQGMFALNSLYTLLNQTPLAYQADGETELHNVELNLRRTGANCWFTNSVLVGVRYINIQDQLTLNTFGPPPSAPQTLAFETTSADTMNHIFGLQLGGDVGFHWDYFHLTLAAEGFVYGNWYDTDARNVISDPSGFFLIPAGGGTFRDSRDEDHGETAGIGAQVGVDAAFNLTQNIIFHAGWHLLALSDVALGSEQLPEVRPSPLRGARISNPDRSEELGSLLFHGPSAGIEVRW